MSQLQEVELNSNNEVINQGIHDAAIVDVKVNGEGKDVLASITCRPEVGNPFVFKFSGVLIFNVNFYGRQNIILDMYLFKNQDVLSELKKIPELSRMWDFEDLNRKIQDENLTLISIVPSNGAELAIVCKELEMFYG